MSELNHGVIEGRFPNDYIAGENSPIGYEVVNDSGVWSGYLPTEEWQRDPNETGTDKMNCVTQSYHNCVETLMYFDHKTGRMPQENWDWLKANGYIDSNGKPNFNDRISAILNNTTHDGNYLSQVAECARQYGLFPETVLPSDESLSWDEYYNKSKITVKMMKLGEEFNQRFYLPYEWVNTTQAEMAKHIKQAPLQIVKPGHAIEEITPPNPLKYFDTYSPFVKSLDISQVSSALKVLVNYKQGIFKPMYKKVKFADGKTYGVLVQTPNGDQVIKATSEDVWRSFSKSDSYGLNTVNADGSTNFSTDIQLPW